MTDVAFGEREQIHTAFKMNFMERKIDRWIYTLISNLTSGGEKCIKESSVEKKALDNGRTF